MRPKLMLYLAGLSLAACGATPEGQSAEAVGENAASTAVASNMPTPETATPAAPIGVRLSGAAGATSIAATKASATQAGWTDVVVTNAQSFSMLAGDRPVAALVTGEATFAPNVPGCFAAVVQGDRVALVPTIGHGEYETTSCGKPVAAGILSPGEPVGIGLIFQAYSPNAESLEPVALRWDASTNALSIDPARSRQASLAGAQSIADMRRAMK